MIKEWLWPVAAKKKPTGAVLFPDGPPLASASGEKDRGVHEILPNRSFAILGIIAIILTSILIVRTLYAALQVVVTNLRGVL